MKNREKPEELLRRPGFLLRRAHQRSAAIFAEESRDEQVTPPQYGAMVFLANESNLDQITLGRRLGMDRTTIGLVVRNLAGRGYLTRQVDPADARRRVLRLTRAGHAALVRLTPAASRAQERLLAPLTPQEREALRRALARISLDGATTEDVTR